MTRLPARRWIARLVLAFALFAPSAALGAPLSWLGEGPAPTALAVDFEGYVYVTDYTGDRVLKLTPDGIVQLQWGSHGVLPGQFSNPFGLALDERGASVLVADQMNGRVQRFATLDGSFMGTWGSPGIGAGELRTPFHLALTGGTVLVADFGNDRVQAFSPDGELLWLWGSRGTGPGQFTRTAGVAIERDGSGVYVSDHFNNRVQKLTLAGRMLSEIGTVAPSAATTSVLGSLLPAPTPTPIEAVLPEGQLQRPEGLALDRDGNLYVADYGRHRIAKFAPDGQFVRAFGQYGTGPGEMQGPKGVSLDALGRLYVADTGNGRVQRFAADGQLEAVWSLPPLNSAE